MGGNNILAPPLSARVLVHMPFESLIQKIQSSMHISGSMHTKRKFCSLKLNFLFVSFFLSESEAQLRCWAWEALKPGLLGTFLPAKPIPNSTSTSTQPEYTNERTLWRPDLIPAVRYARRFAVLAGVEVVDHAGNGSLQIVKHNSVCYSVGKNVVRPLWLFRNQAFDSFCQSWPGTTLFRRITLSWITGSRTFLKLCTDLSCGYGE
jgi:hypothetical protein